MIQLNLLPDIKKEFIHSQRVRTRVITISIFGMIGAFAIVALAAFYVYVMQQMVLIPSINGEIAKNKKTLQAVPDTAKYLTVQNQLKALPGLHQQKTVYSRTMDILPVLNPSAPNSINLTTLNVNEEAKSLVFTGKTQSFESLASFKDTLVYAMVGYRTDPTQTPVSERLFSAVSIENSGLSQDSNNKQIVSFVVRGVYNEKVFQNGTEISNVSIPSMQSSQKADANAQVFQGAQQ